MGHTPIIQRYFKFKNVYINKVLIRKAYRCHTVIGVTSRIHSGEELGEMWEEGNLNVLLYFEAKREGAIIYNK